VSPDDLLGDLLPTLEQLRLLLPSDKSIWDGDLVVRLAVERLWITAGNLAETYRTAAGIDSGIDPWAELAGYRNLLAHALPGDVSADRVFADGTADIGRILTQVRAYAA